MIEAKLREHILKALLQLGIQDIPVVLERPADIGHGDFATNVAMAAAKRAGKNPRALAEAITETMSRLSLDIVDSIEVAGPGFINFKLSHSYFAAALKDALQAGENFGINDTLAGKKVAIEYIDPNPFKEFHIGHLMQAAIGESLARIVSSSGAETKRVCYQGDVGMHIASAVWGMLHSTLPEKDVSPAEHAKFLGGAYALGATKAKEDEAVKKEIAGLNKKIYARSDEEVNKLYDLGKAWSLEYFETIYKRLGINSEREKAFDLYFLESVTAVTGEAIVALYPEFFEKSDGAIVFHGEKYDPKLHTRVFINNEGLPTYETKELGLAKVKFDAFPYDISIVVTGNEINEYFQVLMKALSLVYPELAAKTEHYSHGMLRLPTGKMSSRTGNVTTALSLIDDTKVRVSEKIKDSLFTPEEKEEIVEAVAIGAIKYSILRQASGKDIIFDFEQSLSFEGDSGPYLQYAYARTRSLLAKAEGKKIDVGAMTEDVRPLHKYILRFPEVMLRAEVEREPHYIATYLIELAREFSAFYANTIVLDGAPDEPYKLALVSAVSNVLRKGLWLLGMPILEKM